MAPYTLFATGAGMGLLAGAGTCALTQAGFLTAALTGDGDHARHPVRARPTRTVTFFLVGKLLSHAAAGAALGLFGQVLQPGPRLRAGLLAVAAAVMVWAALRLLARRRRSLASVEPACSAPPRAGGGEAGGVPNPAAWRAALLGVATIVAPCAITVSVALIAIGTRSPVGGAAAMAGFVIGTTPLFAVLGVTLTRALNTRRGRLVPVVAVALLALGGWTLMSALRLADWWPAPSAAATGPTPGAVSVDSRGIQHITVYVTGRGYRPALLTAESGRPTRLTFHGHNATGCARVLTVGDNAAPIIVPPNGPVGVDLARPGPGRLRFVCTEGMYAGSITFRPAPDRPRQASAERSEHRAPE